MKASEIKDLSIEDIKAKIAEEKAAYAKLKINHKVSQLENPLKIQIARKHIARLATVLNQKLAQQ